MNHTAILGTGSYLPEKILTNQEIEKIVDTTDEWIVERTGIRARHIASEEENAATMAEIAGRRALEAAGISAAELGLIIVSSTTPSMIFPSTACLLQARLGITGCAAFDLNATACAGFVYAFSIADQFIKTGAVKYALVIGSEVMSRIIDWQDRATCVLFGDGAGAVILGKSTKPGVISTHLHADGAHHDVLYLPLSLKQTPALQALTMNGSRLFKLAVTILDRLFDETLAANHIEKSELDWLVPHQANIRIIQAMAKKLNLPMDRVTVTLDKQGNTSSASIPIALDEAVRDKRIKRGQLIMMEGFGGGLAWGSVLLRY